MAILVRKVARLAVVTQNLGPQEDYKTQGEVYCGLAAGVVMRRRDKLVSGKWTYIEIDSGVKANPEPTTERGRRRREKKGTTKKDK